MPNYTYTDGETEITVIHPFDFECEIITGAGVVMWRKPPQGVGVNWNGPSPSALEGQHPDIREHVKNADRLRDEYERTHENE